MHATASSFDGAGGHASGVSGSRWQFWRTPWLLRVHIVVTAAAACSLPFLIDSFVRVQVDTPAWVTGMVLVGISVLNVEISRTLTGGLERSHQPHKALSAWAFTCALVLPTPWLLVVVPLTYVHARWRGLRLPLWKWVGSGCYLVLAGVAAAVVRNGVLGDVGHGMGGWDLAAMFAAAASFLAVETVLFFGSATFNHAEDEAWLRRTLTSRSFYATEVGVLFIGGLLAAVWTAGPWFVLLFLPIYALVQRAALHEPLRERAEAAAQLAAKNAELELANQFKIDLMGMLGHEIGNPLTAIVGYAQIGAEALADGGVQLGRESLAVVERNAAQIQHVVHEILTLVSSDRGALTAHPEQCLLEPHLRAVASSQRRGQQPSVECPSDLAALVQPVHLDQILTNLVSNADKYAGGAMRLTAKPTADGQVEVCVVDAGPGVAPEFREHLFQRFSRDAGTAQKVMGTGLGLFIARELARANGGEIVLRDGTPAGSVFVVALPQAS